MRDRSPVACAGDEQKCMLMQSQRWKDHSNMICLRPHETKRASTPGIGLGFSGSRRV